MQAEVNTVHPEVEQSSLLFGDEPRLEYDYSEFDGQQKIDVIKAVLNCKLQVRRTAEQLVEFSISFHELRKVCGSSFHAILKAEFPYLSERTMFRYLKVAAVCQKNKFLVGPNIAASAISLLVDAKDDVLSVIREKLENGEKVSADEVKLLIEQMKQEDKQQSITLAGDMAEMSETLTKAQSDLKDTQRQLELAAVEKSQLEKMVASYQSAEKAAVQESVVLSEEIAENKQKIRMLEQALIDKDKNPAVQEVVKEVVPEGYETIEDAIADAKKKLQESERKLAEQQDKIKKSQQELEAIESQKKAVVVNSEKLMAFVHQIENMIEQYPAALVAAIASGDDSIKPVMKRISTALRALADNVDQVAG